MEKTKREVWVDVAKGLGIILVVLGHTDKPFAQYIYWFHMPLFFALSGYLFRPMDDACALKACILKRVQQLLVPYACFVVLLFIAHSIQYPPANIHQLGSDLLGVAAGGRMIPRGLIGLYAPIWFITCLFATQALFLLITYKWRSLNGRMAVVLIAYILAHIESWAIIRHHFPVPWDLDVALMGLTYYSFGYFGKEILSLRRLPRVVVPASLILSVVFLLAGVKGIINYELDLKYAGYHHILLDLVIPLTLVVAACAVSHTVARLRIAPFLCILGTASLTIMYVHMYVNELLSGFFSYGILLFTVFGTFIPLGIWWMLRRSPVTARLFLGAK